MLRIIYFVYATIRFSVLEDTVYFFDHFCDAATFLKPYNIDDKNNVFQIVMLENLNKIFKRYIDGLHSEPDVVRVEIEDTRNKKVGCDKASVQITFWG